MEGLKRVAIISTFRDFDPAYSLCNVANDQLKMFVKDGYKPKFLVTQGFKPERACLDPNVEMCYMPDQVRQNTVSVDKTFEEDVDKLEQSLLEHLKDVDVVITHDIIYQPDALKHNIALRRVAEKYPLRFLHWIHSATSPYQLADLRNIFPERFKETISKQFPRSYYVFFNNWSIPRIANHYQVPESWVKVVHHPTDYAEFAKYHPITRKIVDDYQLFQKEYICVYPARLDTGKQLEYPIKLMGALKKMQFNVQFIAADFHSSSNDPKDPKVMYRHQLKGIAIDAGLNEKEVLFTSELMPETKVRVPNEVVADLFDLSNIFFMSSSSESYSLVTQEAAMKGNLLIVNRNFPPFRDIFGSKTLKFPCHSNVNALDVSDGATNTSFPEGETQAYLNLAKEVVANTISMQELTRRKLLRTRTPDYVFTNELEPLLEQVHVEFPS